MSLTIINNSELRTQNSELYEVFKPEPLPEEVIEVFAPRRKQHMLDWMQQNYILPSKSSRIKGPWSLTTTPYWRIVIDWLCDLTTRVIWVYACTQSGKSTILGGWIGYCIDVDPGPMKVVLPDEKIAKKRIKRLKPAFENSPRILRHLGGDIRNLLIGEPTDLDNMQLILAWPTSPATLSDDPCRYVAGDEVREWDDTIKDDTDAISLLDNRVRTYEQISKQFYATSPRNKGDLADVNFEACQVWSIWIPCPHCGEYHEAGFENVFLAKDANGELLKPAEYKKGKGRKRNAWYKCPACNAKWSELERKAAVSGSRGCPPGCSINKQGEIVGEHDDSPHKALRVPSVLVDPVFTTVDTLAADFANAMRHKKNGNILPFRNFHNNQNAKAWEERERETSLEVLKTHIDSYSMRDRKVPAKVQIITKAIDVQADHVWVEVKGYGYRNEQWLLYAGRIETGNTARVENWNIVEEFVRTPWISANDDNVKYWAAKVAVDCGYQRKEDNRSKEESTVVYDFCLRFPPEIVIPIMGFGRGNMRDYLYRKSPVIGKALIRYDINADIAKDRGWQALFDKERTPGPGYMHLPNDLPESYLKQFISESQKVKRSRTGKEIVTWELKSGFRDNHLWDLNGYCDLCAELAGVFFLRDIDYVRSQKIKVEKNRLKQKSESSGYWDGTPTL